MRQEIVDLMVGMHQGIVGVRKEIGVFEIDQDCQIDENTERQPKLSAQLGVWPDHLPTDLVVGHRRKDQQQHEEAAGLVVKEETDEEQVGIPQTFPGVYDRIAEHDGSKDKSGYGALFHEKLLDRIVLG